MPDYAYRAADVNGMLREGMLTAGDTETVTRQLRAQGLIPLSVTEHGLKQVAGRSFGLSARTKGGKVTQADVLAFTSELAVMLRAGLSLDRALRVLIGMSHKATVATLLEQVLEAVKGGAPLSRALEPNRPLLGDFYINMVRSGETGGQLSDVLTRLVEHLERMRALRENVVSALIYPAILTVVAILSLFVMLGFVVPQFEPLFKDMGEALPTPTRLVMEAGQFFRAYGMVTMAGVFGTLALLSGWFRSPIGRVWWQSWVLGIPVLGTIVHKYEITRFARSLGTLLGNGVPIIAALRIATETVSNLVMRRRLEPIAEAMKRGGRMADALQKSGLFEALGLNLVRVGEETGRLDAMLLELARIFDRQVEMAIKRGLALLEPILILVMGVVVASIIVSILMGILSVNDLATN